MRRTKIVCTLGPSSSSPAVVRQLVCNGMDVARLNFSHGTHDDHRTLFQTVRTVAAELGANVAILMDLQGPKIRTGPLAGGGPVTLEEGAEFCVTTRPVPGDQHCVSTTYASLPYDVNVGDRILLADGTMELVAERVAPPDVACRVVRGGELGTHKGINLPGVNVSAPALTEKDVDDLALALHLGADYVALSFVRTPEDVGGLKERIDQAGAAARVVAKIERPEALDHFDAIVELADAIMVARGDLGVEVNLEDVPQIQKTLIRKSNDRGKPVITATQMLESMMTSSRPTRAEVTDVANAIYDGTDAVMLSGETAAGRFPLAAVSVMAGVAYKADRAVEAAQTRIIPAREAPGSLGAFSDAIGHAVCNMGRTLGAKRIVCFTQSGYTAAAIARYRPPTPITAITLSESTRRQCALLWGVEAIHTVEVDSTDAMVRTVEYILLEQDRAAVGDTVIIVAGTPLGIGGHTNLLRLHVVGQSP